MLPYSLWAIFHIHIWRMSGLGRNAHVRTTERMPVNTSPAKRRNRKNHRVQFFYFPLVLFLLLPRTTSGVQCTGCLTGTVGECIRTDLSICVKMTASSCPESFEECATTTTTTPSPACGKGAYQNTTEGEAAGEGDDPADGSVAAAAASCKPCPANTYMDEASHQYKVCKDALSNPCPPGTRFVSTVRSLSQPPTNHPLQLPTITPTHHCSRGLLHFRIRVSTKDVCL